MPLPSSMRHGSRQPWPAPERGAGPHSGGHPERAELQRLRTAARADLTERVTRLAARMGVDFAGITIRAQRTRWGSCSARGSLSFNCLLMLAPPEMREYVAVHELCHRKQMNHSAAFWREVALWLPDYAAQRAWLREHGRPCSAACRKHKAAPHIFLFGLRRTFFTAPSVRKV